MMNTLIVEHLKRARHKTPAASAVIFRGTHHCYAELDRGSDRIAWGLHALGVEAGARIGLYLDKSMQAVACMYGILKVGAAYVPMSTSDPAARTLYMLNNSGARFVIVAGQPGPELNAALEAAGIAKVYVNDLLAEERKLVLSFIPYPVASRDIAAVLHTSGSTGDPKGAMITHGNLAVFLQWTVSAFGLHRHDRLLSHAPLQFDLSFFDIFSAAAAGAAVVLAEPEDTGNAVRMAQLVEATGVTVWQSVPPALTLMTLSLHGERMPTVRQVLFAGEPMARQTLLKLPGLFPQARLHNVYGCTETNDTFMYSLPMNVQEAPDPLPIGRVLAHIRYRIVDQDEQDVAPGEQGHLLVAGETVMAGYLGSPARSVGADGYYRTHDLVSEDNSGLLQFHGRIDAVIKTNGYRVNLTEIEDYLYRSGKFKEVALFSVKDDAIGQRIVATLRPLAGVKCSALDLKIYCARGLPKYAIPHSFHFVEHELPKGNTGKTDRRHIASLWQQEQLLKKQTLPGEKHYELA